MLYWRSALVEIKESDTLKKYKQTYTLLLSVLIFLTWSLRFFELTQLVYADFMYIDHYEMA